MISQISKLKSIIASIGVMLLIVVASSATVNAWSWSGGLNVMNSSNGQNISHSSYASHAYVGQKISFRPQQMSNNAHHFTVIVKNMTTGQMEHGGYRTMVNWDCMMNPNHHEETSWMPMHEGSYWLQINAYTAQGQDAGAYYSILKVEARQTGNNNNHNNSHNNHYQNNWNKKAKYSQKKY